VAVLPEGSRLVRDYGQHPGYIVPRLALDDLLRRALEGAGARVVEGVSARRVVAAPGGGRVETDSDVWRGRVIIAADGPGSVAWSALGRRPPRAAGLALATTAYVEGLRPAELADASEHYFERWLPAGYGWIFPAVEGVANVGVYQRSDRYHRGGAPLAKLLERFVQEHPERFDGARILRVRSWSLPLATRALPLAAPGLLTAGDAARIIDPLTGEGIWHALRSGELAGVTAAAAARSGGLSRMAARRHALRVAREVSWPAAGRRLIQEGMSVIVERQLDETVWVRRALAAGYGGGTFEISKAVGD
jgi:flavin-dependent dehydrogenase